MIRDLTVRQIAARLNYTEYWIRLLARDGKIPATKTGSGRGRYWLFNEEEVRKALFNSNNFSQT